MRHWRRSFSLTVLGVTLLGLCGCPHSSQESRVAGQVRLDGTAIGPGTVVFAPVGAGKPSTGSIDDNGSYSMNTSRDVGLAAGKYKVAVSIREMPQNVKRGDRPPPGKLRIPEKYESDATSGLQYEVQAGSNTINVELQSK